MGILNETEHARIASEIAAAEAKTSGEIYAVLARQSDGYFYPAAFTFAIAMLIVSLLAAWWVHYEWMSITLVQFVCAQILAYAALLALLRIFPDFAIRFVGRRTRYRHAHNQAMRQFLARNIHITQNRTGVLIFVSLMERYAEIMADSAINEKVRQEDWNAIVAGLVAAARSGDLAEGYVEAVRAAGALLATHFPPGGPEAGNELRDHLIEI